MNDSPIMPLFLALIAAGLFIWLGWWLHRRYGHQPARSPMPQYSVHDEVDMLLEALEQRGDPSPRSRDGEDSQN